MLTPPNLVSWVYESEDPLEWQEMHLFNYQHSVITQQELSIRTTNCHAYQMPCRKTRLD